jgi:hypothetical protein
MTRIAFVGVVCAVAAVVQGAGAAPARTSFTNFTVSSVPGTVCPGGSPCSNPAAEPAIRADGDGNFFASSENGLGAGTEAWRSLDGGLHYEALASPNQGSEANNTGFAPGGGDTDLAVAPARNAQGNFNVYVASLSLVNVDVSTSTDKGMTWTLNPVTTPETIDDREWIAADGAQTVCISYHNAPQGITVGCSIDAGATFTQFAPAIDPLHSYQTANNSIGNLAIDPVSHTIYQTYSAITSALEVACAPQFGVPPPNACGYHGVYMAVSTDGGATFTDYPVYVNPDPKVSYGHQFVNVSVDRAGNVYSVFTDDHIVSYSFSTDHGRTWSAPTRISKGGTAIMPWSSAGDAGKLDVVYYKTPYYDGTTTPDNYPMSAAWTVGFAQSLSALKRNAGFTETTATPVIHYGGVCESGVTCTGNRDLYDDFGVAASPTTGLASVVYSDDQWDASGHSSPYCASQADSNTPSCDHTAAATQTSGPGIFGMKKKKH